MPDIQKHSKKLSDCMKAICKLLSSFIDDFAIIHIKDKGFNCIGYNGEFLLHDFYDDIQIVEKNVGRTREEFTTQEFLLVRDKTTQLYGLYDNTLNELFPTEYEHIILIGPSLTMEDPMPSQVISVKYPNRRWRHIDLITGCSYESDGPDSGISGIYDNFHCHYGFESNQYHIFEYPLRLEYEAHLPDGGKTYNEYSYWDENSHVFYIINLIKGTAVSFQSDTDSLWKTLHFGEWDSGNKIIINPHSFSIPDDWQNEIKETTICKGFRLKTDYDGLWSLTLIEDRTP